jgi:hypothetical protein
MFRYTVSHIETPFKVGEPITYAPVGHCIYCGSTEGLSKEHVIPYGLSGNLILPKASCKDCRDITSKAEGACLQKMWDFPRIALDTKTRRPEERPTSIAITAEKDVEGEVVGTRLVDIPADQLPVVLPYFRYPGLPGLMRGASPDEIVGFVADMIGGFRSPSTSTIDHGEAFTHTTRSNPVLFINMIAKIAHAHAVAVVGPDSFKPLLVDFILCRPASISPSYLFGSGILRVRPDTLHHINSTVRKNPDTGKSYVVTEVGLFAGMGMATHCVVAGEMK